MITCPQCGMTSHNPNDERERYCGNCHQYHDQMPRILPVISKRRQWLVLAAARLTRRLLS